MEDRPEVERTFADIAATGVRWVRVDLRWVSIEPEVRRWVSGAADWSEMDAIVAAARHHGLKLLAIVSAARAPPPARSSGPAALAHRIRRADVRRGEWLGRQS